MASAAAIDATISKFIRDMDSGDGTGSHSGRPDKLPESSYEFSSYLTEWQRHIRRQQEDLRKLTEMSVTMHRRDRGLTISDMCGRYGTRRNTEGRWIDWNPDVDGTIHPINIVQPAVRANNNACLQSNPSIEIRAANQDAKHKQIAMRWQRVSEYFQRSDWTEEKRSFIFDAVQKDGSLLIHTYSEKAGSRTIASADEQPFGMAFVQCGSCGKSGLTEVPKGGGVSEVSGVAKDITPATSATPETSATLGTSATPGTTPTSIPCPECGSPANAILQELTGYSVGEAEVDEYEIKTRPVPFYNFVIDSYGAKIGGISTAKWLMVSELIDRMEMETLYPHMDWTAPGEWSYQMQCDHALASADWSMLARPWDYLHRADMGLFEKFERQSIYLHADAYQNYVAPADFEFVNGRGESVFDIKRGEKIGEAWERKYGFDPEGLKFIWEGERLIDIISPKEEEVNFRACFKDIHWAKTSHSFYSSPNYSIVQIQDDITVLNTLNHNIIARNAVWPVFIDGMVFEKADFSGDFIESMNAHLLEDRDIRRSVVSLPTPTPSPLLSNQINFLWEIKDSVSQVTPAMRGEQQKGETFGAQRQQLEQSYGLLTSVLKSYAGMLVETFKQKAALAAKLWTLEQFQRIGSMCGELWDENDVRDMCEIDFDQDLVVTYQDGSEMPESNLGREMKFFQGIAQLLPFVQAFPQLLGTDKLTKILQKIDEYADFDFDLTGLEVNDLVAQKRVYEIAELCKAHGGLTFEQCDAARQTVIGVDQTDGSPITQMDVLTEQIFYQAKIRFSQFEDLEQQRSFFIEQLREETGKTSPDYLFLEMLHNLVEMVDEAIRVQQQQEMMADPRMQMAMAQAQAAKESEAADKREAQEREDATRREDRANAVEDRDAAAAQALASQQMAQDHEQTLAANAGGDTGGGRTVIGG